VREAAGSSGRLRALKYLVAGFTMYIPEEPAHPAGTPFPGGYTVEVCITVRAAQGEVDAALCPVVRSRERDLVLTRAERAFVEKEEKLENYYYHFKG
jgi:uncharacterized protein (UPF0305 family)